MTVPILSTVRDWYCPNCGKTARLPLPGGRAFHMHNCPRLRGLSAPMIQAGIAAKVTAHDREDYTKDEHVQTDAAGRPIMSITTEYDNGRLDTAVFAPTAVARLES